MKVSHECPKALLEKSFEFNDFDYFLPSFAHDEDYMNHFLKARENGRFIMMDNGLFEDDLKDDKTLIDLYVKIKPNAFIVPDAWNDADKTYENYKHWRTKIDSDKIMVVLQANNMFEAEELYEKLVADGVKYIGFNHLGQFYDDFSTHEHFETRKTLGRVEFITFLKATGRLSSKVHHHLLGTNFASEFKHYPSVFYPEIKSCDTSNPVTLGFEMIDYTEHLGINFKPKTKVENVFESQDQEKLDLALKNIETFKQFIQ